MKINAHIYEEVRVDISTEDITDALLEMGGPESSSQANKLISACYSLIQRMDVKLFTEGSRKLIANKLREQADRYEVTP